MTGAVSPMAAAAAGNFTTGNWPSRAYNQNKFDNEYIYDPEANDPPVIDYPYIDPHPPLLWTPEQMQVNSQHLQRLYKWSSYFFEMALILGRQIHVQLVARHICDPQTPVPRGWSPTPEQHSLGAAARDQENKPSIADLLPDSLDT